MLKVLSLTLLVLGLYHTSAESPPQPVIKTDIVEEIPTPRPPPCQPCPQVSIQHYKAKSCTPVMDPTVDKCCPARYDCTNGLQRGIPNDNCFYQNKTYAIGESVPVADRCRTGCHCVASLEESEPANVRCAIIECPSLFNPLIPGCRLTYSLDKCCETGRDCSALTPVSVVTPATDTPATDTQATDGAQPSAAEPQAAADEGTNRKVDPREPQCFSEAREYFIGDRIYFSRQPCRRCICTEEFSGPNGPNCTSIDCGINYRERENLQNGCTPLYTEGSCCNSDWICPDSPAVIDDPLLRATGEENEETHCTLGNIVAPVGKNISMHNCQVNCVCLTPPDFTCTQYPSCADAVAALHEGFIA